MNIFITKQIKKIIRDNHEEKDFVDYLKELSGLSFNDAYSRNKFDIKKIKTVPIFDYRGGSRLYCVRVLADSNIYKRIEDCINLEDDTIIFIELHPSSAHERQNEIAQNVQKSELFQVVSYNYITDNCKERDISKQLFLFLKNNGNFEPLATIKQKEIIKAKEAKKSPIIVRGVAGSGKTETGIQCIENIIQKEENLEQKSKVLCVTYNEKLLKSIKKSIEERTNKKDNENTEIIDNKFDNKVKNKENKNLNPNIYFLTIKNILNDILRKYEHIKDDVNFDEISDFTDFKEEIINKKITKFHNNYNKICSVFNKYDDYILYSEIHGLIFGSMLLDNDRDIKQECKKITKEHYFNNIPNDYSVIDNDYKELVYDIATEYINYLEINNKSTYNSKCLQCIPYICEEDKFDEIIIDEVQDLTECEIYLLLNLARNINGMFFAGDINQVINPTFFDFKRIGVLLHNKFNSTLDPNNSKYLSENFRNSQSISKIAYFLNMQRKDLFYRAKFDETEEPPKDYTDIGNVYYFNNNIEELKDYIQKTLTTIIAPNKSVCEQLKEKLKTESCEIVEDFKGQENKTIILYNLLTENRKEFDEMYNKDKKQNNIYKYIFNKFYVGVTRATDTLIFIEENPTFELSNKIKEISENISNKEDIAIRNVSFEEFFEKGKDFLTDKLYDSAYDCFIKAENSKEYKNNEITKEQKEELIKNKKFCEILKDKNLNNLQKAESLEKEKFYKEAIEFYKKTNGNYAKIAINHLLLGETDKWEENLIKSNNEKVNIENYDMEIACFLDDMFQEMQRSESSIKTNTTQFKKYTEEIRI